MTNLDSILKSRDITLLTKVSSQSYGFSSSQVWMWELDSKESWVLKNWCFRTVVLEKTLESSLGSKEIKPVNPKGNQPWVLIARTDAEAEAEASNTLATWCKQPTHWKRPWCWKGLRAGGEAGDRGWDGWMVSLNGCEFEQTLGDTEGQGSLGAAVHMVAKSQTQLSNWTTIR